MKNGKIVQVMGPVVDVEFGDNDQLSAHVAHFFNAEILAILSDIEGYYEENPIINPNAKIYPKVEKISQEELKAQTTPNNIFATGGIVTKLKAADFLLKNNRKMFLSSGKRLEILEKFLLEGIQLSGTLFAN